MPVLLKYMKSAILAREVFLYLSCQFGSGFFIQASRGPDDIVFLLGVVNGPAHAFDVIFVVPIFFHGDNDGEGDAVFDRFGFDGVGVIGLGVNHLGEYAELGIGSLQGLELLQVGPKLVVLEFSERDHFGRLGAVGANLAIFLAGGDVESFFADRAGAKSER